MAESRMRYYLVICFVSMVLLTGFNVWFAIQQGHKASQSTCPAFTLIDHIYQAQKPTTATGVQFAKVVHNIVANCPKDS